jgi:hypothetical protein
MFVATPVKVLRRPLESAQYVSIKYTERLARDLALRGARVVASAAAIEESLYVSTNAALRV